MNGTAVRESSGTTGAKHYRQGGPAGGAGRAKLASKKVTQMQVMTARGTHASSCSPDMWIAGRHRG
jgi:hypothetical protein